MKTAEAKVKENKEKGKEELLVGTEDCNDVNCPFHGRLKLRGRVFKGKVIKKFPKRVVIELERMVYVRKYERYTKSRTKLHARLPECIKDKINLGDYIRIKECRPLSKIVHFVVEAKLKEAEETEQKTKQKSKPQTKAKSKTKSKTKKKKRK